MSDKTDDLVLNLHSDLSAHLDEYQLGLMASGGSLWPDATVVQAQCFALGQSLLKKYNEKPDPSPDACAIALGKFLDSNVRCNQWELRLEYSYQEVIHGTIKRIINDFWNEHGYNLWYTWDEIFSSGSLGAGMNCRARGSDLYTKLWDSPLTYVDESLPFIWETLCARDPRWSTAERLRSERYGSRQVAGNNLSFVNKNVTVARSICTEPTLNMWFQLGIGARLEERLKSFFGIDLQNQQEINGELARIGSETGRFATIDLESASDSVGCRMLQEILPASMLDWLMRTRSPYVSLPNKREKVRLDMISSMGNGFTFPLETLVFSAVVAAVYAVKGYSLKQYGPAKYRNFGVFGDDIIVVTELAPLVIETLGTLGFRVNRSKTFVEGPFRESCGRDWYNGHWCRGIYIKSLRRTQDAYVAINGLNRWSAITGVYLPDTVRWLFQWCRRVLFVPPDESDDSGVHVPLTRAVGYKLQKHGLISYQLSKAVPLSMDFHIRKDEDDGCFAAAEGQKLRHYNREAAMLCFLRGNIKGSRSPAPPDSSSDAAKKRPRPWGYCMTLRQRDVRYKTKRRVTSSWDNLRPESRYSLTEWPSWSRMVSANLPAEM